MNTSKLHRRLIKEMKRYFKRHPEQVWIPDYWMATLNQVQSDQREAFLRQMQHEGYIIPHPTALGRWRLPAEESI